MSVAKAHLSVLTFRLKAMPSQAIITVGKPSIIKFINYAQAIGISVFGGGTAACPYGGFQFDMLGDIDLDSGLRTAT
jgi:hypothetical protein